MRRYLAGEVVLAAPPGAVYRLRKFVRRHRLPVAAASAVAVALVLGLAGTAWQAKVASERAHELRQVSDFQQKMLAQVDPTTAGVRLTEDVTRRFAAALEKARLPEGERIAQAEAFRRNWARVNATDAAAALVDVTILQPAAKAIEEQFRDQPAVDAQLRQALADRYRGLGLHDVAFPLQERALATRRRVLGEEHPDTLTSIDSLGLLLQDQGRLAEAEPYCREALEKSRRVRGEQNPSTLVFTENLARALQQQGRHREVIDLLAPAEPAARKAFTGGNARRLGGLLTTLGRARVGPGYDSARFEAAEANLLEAHPILVKARGEAHKDTLEGVQGLVDLYAAWEKAEPGKGYGARAAEWKAKLASAPARTGRS